MSLKYEKIDYKKYGKCLRIDNGFLEVIATLELGPRIISLRRLAGENIFFEDLNDLNYVTSEQQDEIFFKGATWHSYGGHRLWKSPEDYATYYPDNDPITYHLENNKITLIQKPQIGTNLQLIFSLDFEEENLIKVSSKIKNLSNTDKKIACWSLTMCKGPGLEIVPLPNDETGFNPQRYYSLWNFGAKNNDPRAYYGDKFFSLRMEPGNPLAYKVGMKLNKGNIIYLTKEDVFVKKFKRIKNAVYSDNNVNYETYTKDLFMELESLGEYKEVKPNEELNHHEYWSLFEFNCELPEGNDEMKFQKLVNKYI
ncbi:hypothetical protein RJI07_02865 [Mycoplasmatota bacterium WC30]